MKSTNLQNCASNITLIIGQFGTTDYQDYGKSWTQKWEQLCSQLKLLNIGLSIPKSACFFNKDSLSARHCVVSSNQQSNEWPTTKTILCRRWPANDRLNPASQFKITWSNAHCFINPGL